MACIKGFLRSSALIVLLVVAIFASNSRIAKAESTTLDSLPFKSGERLVYIGSWMGITAGEVVLEVLPGEGNSLILTMTAKSTGLLHAFYPVDDKTVSYFDPVNIRSLGADIHISENQYKKRKVILFNHDSDKAVYGVDDEQPTEYDIYPNSNDSLSVLYALRTMRDRIIAGEALSIPVFDDRQKYELQVKILRKEKISLGSSFLDTIVIEPQLMTEGVFQSRGSMTIWLSDDGNLVPVKIKANASIGYFLLTLKEWNGAELKALSSQEQKYDE